MRYDDWRLLMGAYVGTTLHRAHDALLDEEAQYWKRVVVELKREADVK